EEGVVVMDTFVLRAEEGDRVLMVGTTQQKDKDGPMSRANLSQGPSEILQNPPQCSKEDDDKGIEQGISPFEHDPNPSSQKSPSEANDQGTLYRSRNMEEDSEERECEVEISDIKVGSIELDISMSQQKLKNIFDTKAHQDRVRKGKQTHSGAERSQAFVPRQIMFGRGSGGRGSFLSGRGGSFGAPNTAWKEKPRDVDKGPANKTDAHQMFHKRPKPKSWAALLNPSKSFMNLEYIEPINWESPKIIEIENEFVDEESWEGCLVGYFLDVGQAFNLV
ncbi:hypothetical protein U1Q18_039748, partial [Sarracenia purpurea var. burkii]